MTTTNPNSNIPPEIWANIFKNTILRSDRSHDLLTLCSVSSAFHAEAERLLYTSVYLQIPRQIKSFCATVIRRPHVLQHLHTFTIKLPSMKDFEAAEITQIVTMLHLSTNLQHLNVIALLKNRYERTIEDPIPTSIIEGHAFKLKSFVNSYFLQGALLPFLKSQPTLETLIMEAEDKETPLDWTFLTNLKNLSVSAESTKGLDNPSDRPGYCTRSIERLELSLGETITEKQELPLFIKFKPYICGKLKSLSLSRLQVHRFDGRRMADFVSVIADQFPDIKFLCIRDYATEFDTQYDPFLTPLPTGFTQLETLVLQSAANTIGGFDIEIAKVTSFSSCKELRTDEGRLQAGTRILASLPTLKRLVIIDEHLYEFNRKRDSDINAYNKLPMYAFDEEEWLK